MLNKVMKNNEKIFEDEANVIKLIDVPSNLMFFFVR